MDRRPDIRHARGFTLVEVATVIVIIGVLAVIGTVIYTRYRSTARLTEATEMTQQIRAAQEAFKSETGIYANISSSMNGLYPAAAPGKFVTEWGAACLTCLSPDGWKQIHVNPHGPVIYGYATIASLGGGGFFLGPGVLGANPALIPPPPIAVSATTPVYVTVAWGDTNADGTPSIVVSYSVSNQMFVQEE